MIGCNALVEKKIRIETLVQVLAPLYVWMTLGTLFKPSKLKFFHPKNIGNDNIYDIGLLKGKK